MSLSSNAISIRSLLITGLVLGLAWLLLWGAPIARAAGPTCTVTASGDSGAGTLRQCVTDVDTGGTIDFAAGLTGQTITLITGEILLDKSLTITGTVPITVSGNTADRVFHIGASGVVTLSGLSIISGTTNSNNGGGIYNEGTLTVQDSTLSGNVTILQGGGIYNEGNLTVTNSTFSGNSANFEGGGIYNKSNLTVTNSTFSGNSANTAGGGGVYNAGDLTVTNSTFSGNSANSYGGGGINNEGTLTVQDSTFSDNTALFYGGGIYNYTGVLTVTNSTLSGNSADQDGGGIYNESDLTVQNSTLISNSATFGGGGIFNKSGTLTVTNSTLSGNSAESAGGGILNDGNLIVANSTLSGNSTTTNNGGGIDNSGALMVINSTFSGNSANSGGGINNGSGTLTVTNSTFSGNSVNGAGGGIFNYGVGGTLTMTNSTLSGNSAGDGGGISTNNDTLKLVNTIIANSLSGGDCSGPGSIDPASANNLIESTGINACGLTDGTNGNLIGSAPLLGTLADNGGDTQTHALLPGSPAIDAGDDATCAAAPVNNLDQRGIARPQSATCDIGAFESRGFSLTLGGGGNESTIIDTAFASPLTLTVTSAYTEPVDGGQVTFTGPDSGASINPAVYHATISGGEVTQVVTANTVVGSYVVTATARGNLTPILSYPPLTNTCFNPITVQNTNDSGAGSLRQAVGDICSGGIIDFDASLNGQTITLTTGQITIDKALTITGTVPITVSGNNASRIFYIDGDVTISGLTLRDGQGEGGYGGGAIYAASLITLTNLSVLSNTAFYGGAIFANNPIILTNVSVFSNTAESGGAIYASDLITLTNVSVFSNTASYYGGAMVAYGWLTAVNSRFIGNTSNGDDGYGIGAGAIYVSNSSIITLADSLFQENRAAGAGAGALYGYDIVLNISHTDFISNTADGNYGALRLEAYSGIPELYLSDSLFQGNIAGNTAGGIGVDGTLLITNTRFIANQAQNGDGGAIAFSTGTLSIINSTLSGNSASGNGGGVYSTGTLTVTNNTLSGNSATGGGGINTGGTLNLANTIIANSPSGGDCNGTVTADANNLIEDTGSNACDLTDGTNSNIIGVDPLLGTLTDNGGDTQTHALLPNSPAIDAGEATACPADDQRGVTRPQGAACDIGAFESRGFSLTYGGGSDQIASVNTAFTNPLTLTVTSAYTEPVDGGQVVFTGPNSGAGIKPAIYTATISGGAAIQVVTANTISGSYVVTATARGNLSQMVSYTLANQTVATGREIYLPLIAKNFVSAPDLVITELSAAGGNITVKLKNQGNAAVTDAFWVDVYFNPNQTPALNKPWNSIAPAGVVWGVTVDIPAGDTLTLTVGDKYYAPQYSSGSFPTGAQVYGYVDSVDYTSSFGAVRESDENNNLSGPVGSTAGDEAFQPSGQGDGPVSATLPAR